MAIAFVSGAVNESGSVVSTLSVSYSPTNGNVVIVGVSVVKTGLTSITCKDNFGNSLGLGAIRVTAGNPTSVLFYYVVPSTGVTTFTATWNTTSAVSMAVVEYSGVSSIKGLPGNTATGAGTTPTITVTTEDNNDWVVTIIVGNAALTLSTGNSRESSALPSANRILVADNTVATAGSVTVACSATVTEWAITLIELKTVAYLFGPDAEQTLQSPAQQQSFFINALEADYEIGYPKIVIAQPYAEHDLQDIPQQQSFFFTDLDNDYDMSQSTFFRLEELPDEMDLMQEPQAQIFYTEPMDADFEMAQPNPPVGFGGQNISAYRGYWALKAAMQEEDWSFDTINLHSGPDSYELQEPEETVIAIAAMQDEDWSFKPPVVVTAVTPFDEDQFILQSWPDTQWVEDDQVGILITSPSVDEQFEITVKLPVQTTDEDTSQSTFFAREEYPDAEDQSVYQEQVVYQDVDSDLLNLVITSPAVDEQFTITVQLPQYDTDEDLVQSTFFAKEQYSDNDEQFYQYQPPVPAMQEYELFVFGTSVVALPAMPYDTEFNPAQQISYYFGSMDEEEFNWGWLPPLTKVSEDEDQYMTIPQLVYPVTDNDENWGFVPPVGFGGQNISAYHGYWSLRGAMGSEDDWAFNPPIVTVKENFDQDDSFATQVWALDIDDSWGYNPAIVGTGGTQLMGFRGYWIPKMGMASVEDEQQLFTEVLVDDGSQDRIFPSIFTLDEEELFVYGVFVGPLPAMPFDADFNPAMQTSYFFSDMDTEEFDWGFKPPTIAVAQDDSPYDSYVRQVLVYDDMEQFGFNQPVVTVINAFDDNQELMLVRPVVDDIEQFVSHSPFITPTAEVWELDGLPANKPFLYEDDVETFGWVHAVAYPSHILDDDQVPQFPFWSLAWTDDDLSLTTPPPIITGLVPIVYKVMTQPTVQVEVLVGLSAQIADLNIGATVLSNLTTTGFANVENANIFSGVIVLASFTAQIKDIIISNRITVGAILVQN